MTRSTRLIGDSSGSKMPRALPEDFLKDLVDLRRDAIREGEHQPRDLIFAISPSVWDDVSGEPLRRALRPTSITHLGEVFGVQLYIDPTMKRGWVVCMPRESFLSAHEGDRIDLIH